MNEEKNSKHFDTNHLKLNIKERSVKGGAITIVAQLSKLFLQIGSNVVLARLLTPNDFGLVAMVTVVATFILMFKDMGLSQATIQKDKINHAQVSTLFWINVFFGLIIMLITCLLSGSIAEFYNEPDIRNITIALAFGLFIGGLTVQHQALLRRQMKFKELSIIEVSSMLLGVIAAIIAAILDFGYWSLIILQITQASVMMIGCWYFSGWKPGLPVRNSGIGSMLAFGGYMTVYGFVNYFARNLDTILIGKQWGAHQVGMYSRAYSLLLLPIGQLTAPFSGVAVPALSRLQKDDLEFKNYYLKVIKIIAYISMPMIISMAILSYEIIYIVLGDQWMEAAKLFQILAIAAFWQPIASTVGWVYVSLGNVKRMMYWGFIGTTVMGSAIVIGLPWGAEGVAIAYSISMWILVLPIFAFAFYKTPITLKSLFKELKYPLVVALTTGIGFFTFHNYFKDYNIMTSIIATLFGGLLFLIMTIYIYKPIKDDIFNIVINIKNILKRK